MVQRGRPEFAGAVVSRRQSCHGSARTDTGLVDRLCLLMASLQLVTCVTRATEVGNTYV